MDQNSLSVKESFWTVVATVVMIWEIHAYKLVFKTGMVVFYQQVEIQPKLKFLQVLLELC